MTSPGGDWRGRPPRLPAPTSPILTAPSAGRLHVPGISILESVPRSVTGSASVHLYVPAPGRGTRVGAPLARLSGTRRPSVSLTEASGPRGVATGSNLQRAT